MNVDADVELGPQVQLTPAAAPPLHAPTVTTTTVYQEEGRPEEREEASAESLGGGLKTADIVEVRRDEVPAWEDVADEQPKHMAYPLYCKQGI